jgi:hypothetical protein
VLEESVLEVAEVLDVPVVLDVLDALAVLVVLEVLEVLDVLLVPFSEIPNFDKASLNALIKPPPFSPFGGGGGISPC